jgi:hypothetical protein
MTILGNFDFTRIPNYSPTKRHNTGCDILIFADGRIVSGNKLDGKPKVLLDAAPKLHVLKIEVNSRNGFSAKSSVVVGFSGASALTALSAISFCNHVLSHLVGNELPSFESTVKFIEAVFRAALVECSSNVMTEISCGLIVAGYDFQTNASSVRSFIFEPIIRTYPSKEIDQTNPLLLVSAPNDWDLKSKLDEFAHWSNEESIIIDNVAIAIDKSILDLGESSPFGGQLQFARVGRYGVGLYSTQFWDYSHRMDDLPPDWNEGDRRTTMLGYDVFDLRVGQCDFVSDSLIHLSDKKETAFAKIKIPTEERKQDDGDLFSHPRARLINF